MKKLIVIILLISFCGGEKIPENANNSVNVEVLKEPQKETDNLEENIGPISSPTQEASIKNFVSELLAEFPQGIFFNLLEREQICLVENAGASTIRQLEKEFLAGGSTQEKYQEYFQTCNIPPPPNAGSISRPPGDDGMKPQPGGNEASGQNGLKLQETVLSTVHLSYLGSIRSLENDLGNIADPSIVETQDGNLRVYFKNGNEPQAGISGFDNQIHSALSSDGGRTWVVETGVRVPVQSPVEALVINGKVTTWGWRLSATGDALVKYESVDGINFQQVSIPRFVQADCRDADGNLLGSLGDPTITQLNDGSWIFHVQELVSTLGPFNRRACIATSSDGLNWTAHPERLYGGDIDVTTNPAITLNSLGVVEWIWPTYDFMVYRKGSDGLDWSDPEFLPPGGDPDFLDLSNGRKLLAFGNFSTRIGGVLIFTEKVKTNYTITTVHTGPTQVPTRKWRIEGANSEDIKVVNICLDVDLSTSPGASVEISKINNALEVTATDPNEEFANPQCVYILVGPEKIMG